MASFLDGACDQVEDIIADDLRFRAKLQIGEDAYTSLKVKNVLGGINDVVVAAGTGAAIASSSVVAGAFFGTPWAFLPFVAAATPVGWVIAAAVVSGGAWIGVSRFVKGKMGDATTVIPRFINTPIDVLAVGLFGLIAPLAIKVAKSDGHIDEKEILAIRNYFVEEWGYNQEFTTICLTHLSNEDSDVASVDICKRLREFMEGNKDCNAQKITSDILKMLNDVVYADGMTSPREEAAIKEIEASIFPSGTIDKAISTIKNGICEIGDIIGKGTKTVSDYSNDISLPADAFDNVKNFIKDSSSLAERAKQKLLGLKFKK